MADKEVNLIAHIADLEIEFSKKIAISEENLKEALADARSSLEQELQKPVVTSLAKGRALLHSLQRLLPYAIAEKLEQKFYLQLVATLLEQQIELVLNEANTSIVYEFALCVKECEEARPLFNRYLQLVNAEEDIIKHIVGTQKDKKVVDDVIAACIRRENDTALQEVLPYIKKYKNWCWKKLVAANKEQLIITALKAPWLTLQDKNQFLLVAAKNGNKWLLTLLLDYGADINYQDHSGVNAMMQAVAYPDIITFLLNKGADSRLKNNNGETLFVLAMQSNCVETIGLLLQQGVEAEEKNHQLRLAAGQGNSEIVALLLANGADSNYIDQGHSPLVEAACKKHMEVVKLLLLYGANIEQREATGCTAFIGAILARDIAVAKLLLTNGADCEAKELHGETALISAVKFGEISIVEFLLNNGADINNRDNEGRSALIWATILNKLEIAKLLQEHVQQETYKFNRKP